MSRVRHLDASEVVTVELVELWHTIVGAVPPAAAGLPLAPPARTVVLVLGAVRPLQDCSSTACNGIVRKRMR